MACIRALSITQRLPVKHVFQLRRLSTSSTDHDSHISILENMNRCIELARQAEQAGDVPVGAVITGPDGALVACAENRSTRARNVIEHAEVVAMHAACTKSGASRLDGHTLFVSLEPCVMCLGAALQHKLARIVYASPSPKFGARSCGVVDLLKGRYNHTVDIVELRGAAADASSELLRNFFKDLRGR
jgi:tRNA(Arg) A34 adenosine deaminase TadA